MRVSRRVIRQATDKITLQCPTEASVSTYLRTYDSFRREAVYAGTYVCDTTYGIVLSRRSTGMITLSGWWWSRSVEPTLAWC